MAPRYTEHSSGGRIDRLPDVIVPAASGFGSLTMMVRRAYEADVGSQYHFL
jgi:hypothetical protein